MKSYIALTILLPSFSLASVLQERQACIGDRCFRAINGTGATGTSNCIGFMTSTVLVDPNYFTSTATVSTFLSDPCAPTPTSTSIPTSTSTGLETTRATIPLYATRLCPSVRYASACFCLGIPTGVTTTTGATVLRTVTTTIISRATGTCTSATDSTSTITLTFSSTTSTTVITMSSSDGTGTWTGTGTGTAPHTSFTCSHSTNTTTAPPSTDTTSSTPTTITASNTTSTSPTSTTETSTNTTSTPSSSATQTATSTTSSTTSTPTRGPIFCAPPFATCNSTCVSLATSPLHCGACNTPCPSGTTCTNGVCTRLPCDSRCGAIRACGAVNSTCICGTDVEGNGLCFNGAGFCDEFPGCTTTSDCALGTVCVPNTCCGRGVCLGTAGCSGSLTLELSRRIETVPSEGGVTLAGLMRVDGGWGQ
ncbi:hypothetical protein M011DRAFT_475629 [Sporormia fimetaria CBS 119925]|uniref:IGFBP N-terminal domain-containing protein n=1 Tax=Sporormia fimetaria CBS 119925 TaxID=1340428 RepID=A0A6A6VJ34_9PLEO|nr:hypothetical protein M011DRAFT_475629 [Sporormia fimetaria CBS 119925]